MDLTGAVVTVNLASGGTSTVNLPDGSVIVSAFNNALTGSKQHLTVSLNGKTATNTIDVECYNYITSSTLTEPNKAEYKYGESLNLTGGRIRLNWKTGAATNVNLVEDMITGYKPNQKGTQTLTVTYNAKYTLSDGQVITDTITHTFEVEVLNTAKSISITPPAKTVYNHGENLNLARWNNNSNI
ncbi:MAG: hypothetical protein HFJ54_08100 [Clostridia bacterium]|nr:hypothetical protein [Clostridia bacterium]